jgi:membrane protease YdiL (CAAX protease family)
MPERPRNALVWFLIVLLPVVWIGLGALEAEPSPEAGARPQVGSMTQMQGRMAAMLGGQALAAEDPLGTRPMARLAAAILLARAGDRERAEAQLDAAAESPQAPEPELLATVRTLVQAWPSERGTQHLLPQGTLTEAQWTLLDERMGWFGRLARAELTADPVLQKSHAEDQNWLFIGLFAVGGWFLMAGVVGLALLVTVAILAGSGRIRSGLEPMPPMHTLLGETFVVWMVLFLGIRLVAGLVLTEASDGGSLWTALAFNFASLAALAWATLRGAAWRSFRTAVGLHMPGSVLRLAWMSACSYACALPCMAAGLLLGALLSSVSDRSFQDVSHPVQDMLPGAAASARLALFLLAVVAAPVVEEIAFRGLLYGHVRQVTPRWPRWLSMSAAMLVSASIFAAIHPQGLLAMPALAGISLGFCITREWSGSVLPGMVAHGFHNGLLLALNLLLQP